MNKGVVMNNVVFNPYVGKDYESNGEKFLGKRIMVVGASHYCEHYTVEKGCSDKCPHYGNYRFHDDNQWFFGKKCERFTEIVIERYRKRHGGKGERNWFRTFSSFYNSFFMNKPSRHEDRIRILDHIVHTEYLQGAEGANNSVNNKNEMKSDRNFVEFSKMIATYKPDVVLFWGPRAWREASRRCDVNDMTPDIISVHLEGVDVKLVHVCHPSRGFKRARFQAQLNELGIRLIEPSNA